MPRLADLREILRYVPQYRDKTFVGLIEAIESAAGALHGLMPAQVNGESAADPAREPDRGGSELDVAANGGIPTLKSCLI
jgi:hypothetical protein